MLIGHILAHFINTLEVELIMPYYEEPWLGKGGIKVQRRVWRCNHH